MNNLPKISILIPTYNRGKMILETLNCAVNQTYKNTEIIVVDNKSTDKSFEIIKEFANSHPNVRAYQNEENIGIVRNWRRCLNYSTGEYVKILWSDDLMAPTFLEKTLWYLVDHDDVGFVITGTEIFNDDTGQRAKAYFIGQTNVYDTGKFIKSALLKGPWHISVSPGNALFRRNDLEKNLLIDIPNKNGADFKMYGMGNDLLIFLLTAKDYSKFVFLNETLAFFRAHKGSATTSSNRETLVNLRRISEAYFVENYVDDIKLRKKFNSYLFFICLKNMFKKKCRLASVGNFYSGNGDISIDNIFFIGLLIKEAAKRASFLFSKR